MKIYFDNAATTKLHPRVLDKMLPYLKENYGNASAVHSFGRKARVAIEDSREIIANFINADPSEIYFTSGGTEANNFIINGIAKTEFKESGKNHIISTAADHKAILNTINNLSDFGFESTLLNLDKTFQLNNSNLRNSLTKQTSLISIIHVNNETGTINDLKELFSFTDKCYFHTDAVQSFGKIKIDVRELGVQALSASAHKMYGPKGIGLAFVKGGTPMDSLILGGGQERNRRAGTENVAAIVGFAEAVKIATEKMDDNFNKVRTLKEYFINEIDNNNLEGISQNSISKSSPYILSISLDPRIYNNDPEATLMYLDINGIAASSGSACASGTLKPSHVIMAGSYSEEYAKGTLRFSFSAENTFEEIDYVIKHLKILLTKIVRV